jgi:hypothetical protein
VKYGNVKATIGVPAVKVVTALMLLGGMIALEVFKHSSSSRIKPELRLVP